jgi:serine/threonine protein kinase
MALATGTYIGPYEIVGWLGAGGMGDVYRARDRRLAREVAIKVIPETFAADSSRVRRFEVEARAAGQLNHPNVLTVYDVGVEAGTPYIVAELLDGESLRSRVVRGALPWREAADYARQIADGLAAAHDKHIVHRDVKPENVFLTTDGRIKVLDFGLAKLTLPSEQAPSDHPPVHTETRPGVVLGTAAYMSPEQVRGETLDARSDLFSVGTILYEMLSGRPAFVRATAAETIAAVLKEDPPLTANMPAAHASCRVVWRKPRSGGFSPRGISRSDWRWFPRRAPARSRGLPRRGCGARMRRWAPPSSRWVSCSPRRVGWRVPPRPRSRTRWRTPASRA